MRLFVEVRFMRLLQISAVAVALAILLASCSPSTGGKPTELPADAENEIVFQVMELLPPILPLHRTIDYSPNFTLWGDGRVVFAGTDHLLHEAHIDQAAVKSLVDQASILFHLRDKNSGSQRTDQDLTVFYIASGRGQKIVKVYDLPAWSRTNDGQRLQRVWEQIRSSLPEDAPLHTPEEVTVVCGSAPRSTPPLPEAPAWLRGTLQGEDAKQAIALIGLGQGAPFRVDGKACTVVLVPSIPIRTLLGEDTEYP